MLITTTQPTTTTTILVLGDEDFAGEIILDDQDRVVFAGAGIPKDVVLKVLVAYTRCNEEAGSVRDRRDGRLFSWQVLGLD